MQIYNQTAYNLNMNTRLCTMSRNSHNIRKKPIFSYIFQHGENFIPFGNLKNLTLSKNTLQNLTAIEWISNTQKVTPVTNP